jgi:hypothetical protein
MACLYHAESGTRGLPESERGRASDYPIQARAPSIPTDRLAVIFWAVHTDNSGLF